MICKIYRFWDRYMTIFPVSIPIYTPICFEELRRSTTNFFKKRGLNSCVSAISIVSYC
nr:MAG TPA: hypothetical protein [Crassvirales sp.]